MTAETNSLKTRIRYSETDRMGFVYYAHYLVFMEMGRTEWLRQKGFNYRDLEEQGLMLPVISISGKYHRAAAYDDEITILTQALQCSRRKIHFAYRIMKDGVLLFEGETMHFFMNTRGKSCSLDPAILESLKRTGTINEVP